MKKRLPKICLGLLAVSLSTSAFAQQPENVTNKLENPSFEYATANWNVDLIPDADGNLTMWSKTSKDQKRLNRFYGFHNSCLQVWKATNKENPVFVGDNGFSQTLTNLPNGTYVFGAYAVAADQAAPLPALESLEGISGVNIIANENATCVATENAEADTLQDQVHARKFNVAANVQDGTLKVGVTTAEAMVNFVCFDECTLYYFGDMSEEDALVAMAKIDLQETMNIADTCLNGKWAMNKDSLELLKTAYEDAKSYVAATMVTDEAELETKWVELRNRIMWANHSIGQYRGVNNALLDSDTLLMVEEGWMDLAREEGVVDKLNDSIALCRQIMEEQVANRDYINMHRNGLREAMAAVRVYELMDKLETVLQQFLDTAGFAVDKDLPGMYSLNQKKQLTDFQEDVQMSYDAYMGGELTARELIEFTPQIQEKIDQIVAMGKLAYNKFPIVLSGRKDGFYSDSGEGVQDLKQVEYTSKLFMFSSDVKKLRFTVTGTCTNQLSTNHPYWTLAELYIYDKNGTQYDINPNNVDVLVTANASDPQEGSLVNLFDGKLDNYYHTDWRGGAPDEYHYVEVTLPEGDYDYTGFSFKYVSRANTTTWILPVAFEITSETSQAMTDLIAAVNNAPSVHQGVEPGYFNVDMSAFNAALAKAKDLVANGATDVECNAARIALEKEAAAFDLSKINLPVEGKQYRLISSEPNFLKKQKVVKAMTAHNDTIVWWETAAADSTEQLFTFERVPDDSLIVFRVKNVATQKYMVSGDNCVMLREAPLEGETDSVIVTFPGNHQFTLSFPGEAGFHNGDHNGGTVTEGQGAYGAGSKVGETSGVVFWDGSIPDAGSSWFVREMNELPLTALVAAGKTTPNYHLYKGLTLVNFATKEPCDFNNFKVYNTEGDTIACTLTRVANSVTAAFEAPVASFSFSFDNSADVEVVVSENAPLALTLQNKYNEAVALAPVQGTNVYQYADLSAYNAALEAAEKILEEGADDVATQAAIDGIDAAVKALTPNMPDPEKDYFILNGFDAFEKNHMTPVAMFENAEIGYPAWTFLQKHNPEYLWKFEEVKPAETDPAGTPVKYNIKNATSGNYLTDSDPLTMSAESSAYTLVSLQGDILAIDGAKGRVHGNKHGGGWGTFGNLVHWSAGVGSSSTWKICEAESVITDIDFTEVEVENESAVKGVYDLFGRRVVAPAKGLYIIDGKKRIIK